MTGWQTIWQSVQSKLSCINKGSEFCCPQASEVFWGSKITDLKNCNQSCLKTVYIASLCFLGLQNVAKRQPLVQENFTTSKRKILLMKNSTIKQSIILWFILTWKLQDKYTIVGWVNHCTLCDCKSQVIENNALKICQMLKGQQRVLHGIFEKGIPGYVHCEVANHSPFPRF